MKPRNALLALFVLISVAACAKRPEAAASRSETRVAAPLGLAERLSLPERTELAGTVVAQKATAVSSRVMALVTAVHVALGDRVAAGQTLISIDPTAAEGQVAQARGALAQAEAGLALARRNFERFEALAAKQAASELELDLARMQFEQARGAVVQAQGAVEAAQSVARESRVAAPFAGRVTQRMIEVGDLAAPGRPLLLLESERGRRLSLAVPESLAASAALAIGQEIPVALDAAASSAPVAGKIVEISPGPDPLTHAYTVKVALAGDVPAGAAARAWLASAAREAVVVPRAALVASGGLSLVVVRDEQGRAQTRVVTVGRPLEGERVELLSGLAGGERLLLGLVSAPPAGALVEEVGS